MISTLILGVIKKLVINSEKEYQIPKIIHYFWIGGNPKPKSVKECIESWKRFCPDFEIKEWNESNYDIHKHPYMEKAYREKQWAFVSDYGRLDVLYQYGGIYLDTDVEVLRDLSPFCEYKAYIGFENQHYVNDGQGIGCVAQLPIVKEMMQCYDGNEPYFYENDEEHYVASPELCTKVLLRHGLIPDGARQRVDDMEILPVDYFCPLNYDTGKLVITENTYSIHHFDGSWHGKNAKLYQKLMHTLNLTFGVENGKKVFAKIMQTKDEFKKLLGN